MELGTLRPDGYMQLDIAGRKVLVHRYVWEQAHGPIPVGMWIDHIDRDKSNNALSNLRLATPSDNNCNRATRRDSGTGVKGVCYSEGKYKTHIQYKGERRQSKFKTLEEATAWIEATRTELHGLFAEHG